MIESWQPILIRCFGFEPGSQEILIIFKLSECYQKTTLNRKPRNVCILIITPVPGSNPLRIRTKGIQAIYYQHIFQDISAPRTRINLSLALLKLCFQAGSFEYNYVEFEDNFILTPRRAMWKLQWVLTRGLLAKMSKKMGFIYLKFDHNTN